MLLQTQHISKQFSGIYALRDINFSLEAGEIHGLVGENGAGKSTLIKILTGVYSLDEGAILWDGREVQIHTPSESRKIGISVIHQDRVLVPSFTAVENAYLGMDYPTRRGHIDWAAMRARVRDTAQELGISLDLEQTAMEMSPPQKTCLEIVRAMMNECRLLILDEPTASLTDRESELLFALIRRLKSRGTAILYVTHRMDEIFSLTDRVTIFKNGQLVETLATASTDREGLIARMTDNWTGDTLERSGGYGEVMLSAEHIQSKDGIVKDASLKVHAGEVLGVFGLGGSGRTELLECIYGYRAMSHGSLALSGQKYEQPTPSRSIRSGMVLICEDRRGKAIIANLSVRENVSLSSLSGFARRGVVDGRREAEAVSEMTGRLDVKLASQEQRVIELSGGNQQKVVFAKAMMTQPRIFLCDEPTQAVDVKTRYEIHKLLRDKAKSGSAVVFVSSDLKEVLEVADRILVMAQGRTRDLLENRDLTSAQVLACCYA